MASRMNLSEEHDTQIKTVKSQIQGRESDLSEHMDVSVRKNPAMDLSDLCREEDSSVESSLWQNESPEPSCVSMNSDASMGLPLHFSSGESSADLSQKHKGPESHTAKKNLDSIFKSLQLLYYTERLVCSDFSSEIKPLTPDRTESEPYYTRRLRSEAALLEDPHCKLKTLELRICSIGEEGCAALISALRSNPSHLTELNLSYNTPGDSGVKLLSDLLEDPHCKLEKLQI
uniref:Uncharacterized protein n=1 Tax=Cyprinus carpio carpio TaxID=630221 RepID=A0A9J7Y7Z7_CYPCA